jgi:hypothetical protein
MKALRLEAWHSPAVLGGLDVPAPGRGEVPVQVGGIDGRAVVVPNAEYRP